MVRDSQKKARDKYDTEKMTRMTFKFHNESDKDVLDRLASVPNKIEYLRTLIRQDIANGSLPE